MKNTLHLLLTLFLSAFVTLGYAQTGDRDCNLEVIVDSVHATAPQAHDGSVNAIATGGTAPYTYRWYTGETSQSRTNLGTGRYCVTVTDANGCTGSDCSRVSAPGCEGLGIGIGMIDSGSLGTNTVYTWVAGGTPPYNYTWSNGANTDTVRNLPDGIYSVTVTDANTCSITAAVGNVNTVGIAESVLNEASVHPNPATNILTVTVPQGKNTTFNLLSLEGRLLLTSDLVKGTNVVNIEAIPSGIYLYLIKSEASYTDIKRKLIISR